MIDGSLVIRVSFDMIQYIYGLWTAIFTKCDALFYMADFCFWWLSIFIALY
jgi:hypothetical protein